MAGAVRIVVNGARAPSARGRQPGGGPAQRRLPGVPTLGGRRTARPGVRHGHLLRVPGHARRRARATCVPGAGPRGDDGDARWLRRRRPRCAPTSRSWAPGRQASRQRWPPRVPAGGRHARRSPAAPAARCGGTRSAPPAGGGAPLARPLRSLWRHVLLSGARWWTPSPGRLGAERQGVRRPVEAEAVILATGAQELFLPFPGGRCRASSASAAPRRSSRPGWMCGEAGRRRGDGATAPAGGGRAGQGRRRSPDGGGAGAAGSRSGALPPRSGGRRSRLLQAAAYRAAFRPSATAGAPGCGEWMPADDELHVRLQHRTERLGEPVDLLCTASGLLAIAGTRPLDRVRGARRAGSR